MGLEVNDFELTRCKQIKAETTGSAIIDEYKDMLDKELKFLE